MDMAENEILGRSQEGVMRQGERRQQQPEDSAAGGNLISGGGHSMISRRGKILGTLLILALVLVWNSCATQPGCPTCGTTTNGAYGVIDIIPVPEHNPTGEPGGPFNSFDISSLDSVHHLDYVSDRIGLAIVVVNTLTDEAVNTIGGLNEITNGGNNASPCLPGIPSIITGIPDPASGGLTRMGCRNNTFFAAFANKFPGFGDNGMFGGFPGAQCCAARANGVNPISGPDGNVLSPDGNTLFVGSGSASVVVFDLTTNPATVIADFPTGTSPAYDSTTGVAPCIATWNGGAGSDPTCADDRSDEMSYGTVNGHDILLVTNGDPGLPFATLIDVTAMVTRSAPGNATGYCLPVNPAANYTPASIPNQGTIVGNGGRSQAFPAGPNYGTCIIGQIYYDASPVNDMTMTVDQTGAGCPDPSTSVSSGASGTGVGAAGADVPCHHSAVVDQNTGAYIPAVAGVQTAGAGQGGEIAVAGLGGSVFNPIHNTFFLTNSNCTVSGLPTQSSVAVGCVDEIDPRIGNANGPVVINVIPTLNCMPTAIVQGPGSDFLVGCGDHDGIDFPPNMIIINGATDTIVATITQTGGVDEIWYNPGDQRYYLAARDYPPGPQLGVIDALTRQWLVNFPTSSNAHSVAADSSNNHILVPSQAGALCGTQSGNGCILVIARQ